MNATTTDDFPVEEIVDYNIRGSKIVCGENIALETISSYCGGCGSTDNKPSPPDIVVANKHLFFLKDNKTLRKVCAIVLLFIATLLVIGVTQIPITLFYTDPPADVIEIRNIVDFRTCQVFNIHMWGGVNFASYFSRKRAFLAKPSNVLNAMKWFFIPWTTQNHLLYLHQH